MHKNELLIKEIRDSIITIMDKFGFTDHRKESYSRKIYEEWLRDYEWKIEGVRMIYPNKDPYFVDLVLDVYLKTGKENKLHFFGSTVNNIVDRNDVWYRFPSMLMSFRKTNFIKTVTNDLEKALFWFGKYKTPKSCINELIADRTHIRGTESKNYNLAIEFLNSIKLGN